MSRVPWRTTGVLAALLASSACYVYQPVELSELSPGLDVRARVSASFAEESASVLGREDRLMEGAVESASGNELLLLVPVVSAMDRRGGSLNQRLAIPSDQLLEVEIKQRDDLRTGLTVGTVVAIGAWIAYQAISGEQSAANDPIRDPPDEDRVIRIPIPIGW